MSYDYVVFIGRFQPAHRAHLEIIQEALKQSRNVIVLIGSSFQPRTSKNPFTAEEREAMIRSAFDPAVNKRLHFRYNGDKLYNNQQWAIDIQSNVQDVIETVDDFAELDEEGNTLKWRIGIIGHKKDNSTFYLDMFPQWELVEFPNVDDLHATTIRDYYFNKKWQGPHRVDSVTVRRNSEDVFKEMCEGYLNPNIFKFLSEWRKTETYAYLSEEYSYYEDYKARWAKAPYAPTFVTTDAVVVQSGHLLLIRRRSYPGKGLWALPGGFLNQNEQIVDGLIRELREETKLKVPDPVLRGSIKAGKVFDHPNRSLRGRTITHAHLIELNPGPLPPVKGSDDAEKARWIPLEEVLTMEDKLFEDHYSIINYFLGRV